MRVCAPARVNNVSVSLSHCLCQEVERKSIFSDLLFAFLEVDQQTNNTSCADYRSYD